MAFQTEYSFTLPDGFIDPAGNLHRDGVMRLATAADEIAPTRDARVRQDASYFTIVLLSRVITRLGTLTQITPEMVECLFARDMAFLTAMYTKLNALEDRTIQALCPQCGCTHEVALNFTLEE